MAGPLAVAARDVIRLGWLVADDGRAVKMPRHKRAIWRSDIRTTDHCAHTTASSNQRSMLQQQQQPPRPTVWDSGAGALRLHASIRWTGGPGRTIGPVCVCASGNNFWTRWSLTRIFGILVYRDTSSSKVKVKGQRSKFTVKGRECSFSAMDARYKVTNKCPLPRVIWQKVSSPSWRRARQRMYSSAACAGQASSFARGGRQAMRNALIRSYATMGRHMFPTKVPLPVGIWTPI